MKKLNILEMLDYDKTLFDGFGCYQDQLIKLSMFYFGVNPEEIMIEFCDEALHKIRGHVKRPVYSVRGKTLSKEDTVLVLSITDNYFGGENMDSILNEVMHIYYKEMSKEDLWWQDITLEKIIEWGGEVQKFLSGVRCAYFKNQWLKDFRESKHYHVGEMVPETLHEPGWLRPDGTIREDSYFSLKYPTFVELLEPWILISALYDKLELVIALTGQDEVLINPEGLTFEEYITHGIYIKGKNIRIMDAEETIEVYKQFDPDKLKTKGHSINEYYDFKEGEREALIKACESAILDFILKHPERVLDFWDVFED